jgi:Fe-S-cluster containining protein
MKNLHLNDDRRWIEQHVIKHGDMLLYGNLPDEMGDIPPDVLWKEFRRIAETYLNGGTDRTRILHEIVEHTIATLIERDKRFGYAPPFCHKGCCNCCHELVYCTSEEAAGIHDYCLQNSIEIDYEKLARQLQYIEFNDTGEHTGNTIWNDQNPEDQSCVFLGREDKSCTIWPVRPLVCRVHLAEATDQFCAPHNGVENPNALGVNYIELSYILSVIFTIHRDSIKKTMGSLLLESKPLGR